MGYRYKFNIAGTEYGMENVQSAWIEAPLFDKLSVGNACAAELEISFWPIADVPKMARIIPYVLLNDGVTWHQLGVFYTDTRAAQGSALNIVAYDAMMRGEIVWEPDQALEFPISMPRAAELLATEMGVELDSRTELNSTYSVDFPTDEQTVRETLMWIGAANCGNWIITNEGKLLFVPLFSSAPAETYNLISENGAAVTFGGVRIRV